MSTPPDTVIIRRADDGDAEALERLSQLDSVPPLSGDVLLAEVDGTARAAIGVRDQRVAADPFFFTQDLVGLLDTRARLLRGEAGGSRKHAARHGVVRRLAHPRQRRDLRHP